MIFLFPFIAFSVDLELVCWSSDVNIDLHTRLHTSHLCSRLFFLPVHIMFNVRLSIALCPDIGVLEEIGGWF